MDIVIVVIPALLVFFILISVNEKKKKRRDARVERGIIHNVAKDGGFEDKKVLEFGVDKIGAEKQVFIENIALHDEKRCFDGKNAGKTVENEKRDISDFEQYSEIDGLDNFSLSDGIVYSIILEKKYL